MAYSQINSADADPPTATTSHAHVASGTAPSPPRHHRSLTPLSLAFEHVAGDIALDDPDAPSEYAGSKISNLISSLTSSSRQSYDLVEEDDYEVAPQTTPTFQKSTSNMMAAAVETSAAGEKSYDTPLRTASISRQLPLNHPMPDLQSLQGAYVKNVERLEESAEQLSITSSLQSELQRMKQEQRQRQREEVPSKSSYSRSMQPELQRQVSVKSSSNSIIDVNSVARSGGYVGSPTGSIRSPRGSHDVPNRRASKVSRLSIALPEPAYEGRPLDSDIMFSPLQQIPDLDPRPAATLPDADPSEAERPTTSGSGDTYQQAKTLFTDFDGVHYHHEKHARESRRISLTRPPRARDSRAFKEPQPGEEMIYYPAPVPVTLNLPVRLSRMNWGEREQRRLQALSGIPDDMRKSAAWLANEGDVPNSNRKSLAGLPPQLRASAFFDHRGITQDVQLKNGSAVATLDSILDAAAHAPVSAFTDHPIAGDLGGDFYSAEKPLRKSMQLNDIKKTKRKSSMSNLLKSRNSTGNLSEAMARESRMSSIMLPRNNEHDTEEFQDEAEESIAPDADELPSPNDEHGEENGDSDHESESHESQHRPGFSAAPTTLLAELQMRKAQQRMRNRTAADAFPNGMHSTLLELDTVTQLQQKARKQKHIKLAWEDKETVDKENYDDDDVPLGLLFPEKEKQTPVNHNRPLGLMEKKELEENEPLSHRRARLRGEPLQVPAPSQSPGTSRYGEETGKPMLDLPSLHEPDDQDQEEETLAQRRQRMKERREHGMSGEFARQVSSELGLKVEENVSSPLPRSVSKTPEIEETLGQRRKRLQAEALQNGVRPALRTKRSLADVLHANPIGYVNSDEGKMAQSAMQSQQQAMKREAALRATQEASRMYAQGPQNVFGNGHQAGLLQTQPLSNIYQQPPADMMSPYVPGINGPSTLHGVYAGQPGFGYPVAPMPMNSTLAMTNMHMNYPYQYPPLQSYGQSAIDLTGMGPPLDSKQRARIEGWRQGVM